METIFLLTMMTLAYMSLSFLIKPVSLSNNIYWVKLTITGLIIIGRWIIAASAIAHIIKNI